MPFTPLHMGPGMAIKAVLGRHFSLVTFGTAQIVMDIEPLVRIIRDDAILHGPTHTYPGALLLALLTMPIARLIHPPLARRWNREVQHHQLPRLCIDQHIGLWPLVLSALIGTLSHVLLDSVMHTDMNPWSPLTAGNGMLRWTSIDALHVFCVVAGVVGLLLWLLLSRWRNHDTASGNPN